MLRFLLKWGLYYMFWGALYQRCLEFGSLGTIVFWIILVVWVYLCYFNKGYTQEEYDEATRHPTPEEIDAYCRERGITDEYGNYR